MSQNVGMNWFHNQRPDTTQPAGAFMDQFDSYITMASFILIYNGERSWYQSKDASSHESMTIKMPIKLDGKSK